MTQLSLTLILSGVVAMAAAYPPGLLQEIYRQAEDENYDDGYEANYGDMREEDTMESKSGDYDGFGMALLQAILQEEHARLSSNHYGSMEMGRLSSDHYGSMEMGRISSDHYNSMEMGRLQQDSNVAQATQGSTIA